MVARQNVRHGRPAVQFLSLTKSQHWFLTAIVPKPYPSVCRSNHDDGDPLTLTKESFQPKPHCFPNLNQKVILTQAPFHSQVIFVPNLTKPDT